MSNYPSQEPSLYTSMDSFSGLNWMVNASRIDDAQATIMENFVLSESGVLSKRKGLHQAIRISDSSIYSMIVYKEKLYIIASNGVHVYNPKDSTSSVLYRQTCSMYGNFFIMNEVLFIMDGFKIRTYDGTNLKYLQDQAYTPTLFINCVANGSGTPLEQWNLLSDKFKQSFSTDGSNKEFFLCFKYCDVLSVTLDGVKLDRTKWSFFDMQVGELRTKLVLSVDVMTKGTDNMIVECQLRSSNPIYIEKVVPCRDRVNTCIIYSLYGGQNDTRVLLGGKDSVFYRSDVYNPYYFPENYYQSVGDTSEKITGFITQYDYCVILKERSIWHTRFELLQNGTTTYTTKPLNAQYGCINPKTVQLIENSPVFMSKKGITSINQTEIRDERNVTVLSKLINKSSELGYKGLLDENLKTGASIDYDGKYIYGVGDTCYIYDYENNAFYTWKFHKSITINSLCELDEDLYIGTSSGYIFRLKREGDTEIYYDKQIYYNGTDYLTRNVPITCMWKSKLFSFDNYSKYKLIENLFLSISPSEKTSVDIKYITDNNSVVNVGTTSNNLMNYANTDYSTFSYTSTFFPVIDNIKIRAKKILFFQIVLENSNPLESLDVFSLGIKFKYQREVKA